jgi:hypothetical protein
VGTMRAAAYGSAPHRRSRCRTRAIPLPPGAPPRRGRLGGLPAAGGVLVGFSDGSVAGMVRSRSRQDESGGALDGGTAAACGDGFSDGVRASLRGVRSLHGGVWHAPGRCG